MSGPLIFETPATLIGAEGTQLGPTEWFAVDQDRVNRFAEVTGDDQWIHVDVERARAGPFGGTIVHGYLTLSLVNMFLPQMIEVRGFSAGVNVGMDRTRFLAPVLVGSRLRARGEIVAVEEIKGAVQSTLRVTVEVEGGDKPALVIDTISRYYP